MPGHVAQPLTHDGDHVVGDIRCHGGVDRGDEPVLLVAVHLGQAPAVELAAAAGVDPFVPALAGTFAASFGFMLPVSTPQNAIVYGSGAVPITTMIRSGISFDIAGAILIVICLPLLIALLGLGA